MNIKDLFQRDFHRVKTKISAFQHHSQTSKQGTEEYMTEWKNADSRSTIFAFCTINGMKLEDGAVFILLSWIHAVPVDNHARRKYFVW